MQVAFLVKEALTLKDWTERFDNVIDSGLVHVFSDEDRRRYVEGLATVLKPGGRLFLAYFSDEEPGSQGPRRVSRQELQDAFAQEWVIESIEPSRFEVRPDLKDLTFSEGGPKAWFTVVRRTNRLPPSRRRPRRPRCPIAPSGSLPPASATRTSSGPL